VIPRLRFGLLQMKALISTSSKLSHCLNSEKRSVSTGWCVGDIPNRQASFASFGRCFQEPNHVRRDVALRHFAKCSPTGDGVDFDDVTRSRAIV